MSELPKLLLEWTPPWVPLRLKDRETSGDFSALCESSHLVSVAAAPSTDQDDSLPVATVLPAQLRVFIGRHLGAAIPIATALFTTLRQVADLARLPRVCSDQLLIGIASVGLTIWIFQESVYRRLLSTFHQTFRSEVQRRRALREARESASVRPRLYGSILFGLAGSFMIAAAVAYRWEYTRPFEPLDLASDEMTLRKLVDDGIVQMAISSPNTLDVVPSGRWLLKLTIAPSALVPSPSWHCPILDNSTHNAVTAQWRIQFSNRQRVLQKSGGNWIPDHSTEEKEEPFGFPETFYSAFDQEHLSFWSARVPPLELLVVPVEHAKIEDYLSESKVVIGLRVRSQCPVPDMGTAAFSLRGASDPIELTRR